MQNKLTHPLVLFALYVLAACSSDASDEAGSAGGDAGAPASDGGAPADPYMLPAGFTPAEFGGYKLGPRLSDASIEAAGAGGESGDACGMKLLGVVRDFKGNYEPGGHPDFEHFEGTTASTGIVKPTLGADRKPVYAPDGPLIDATNGPQTTSKLAFDEWYRNTPDVNEPYLVYLAFEPREGVITFQSSAFFPLDDTGFGNTPDQVHNYSFTTEVHTEFDYRSGETFKFTGDDDLWVFINHKLAIDLGGLHKELMKTLSLDEEAERLGLEVGKTYELDLFHAERHTVASNFRVDTNLRFTNCGTLVEEPKVE